MKPIGIATACVVLGAMATAVSAHPLGNFTVNRYARLEPGAHSLVVVYVVDYAEIPTLQELSRFPSLAAIQVAQALSQAGDARNLERELAAKWVEGLHVSLGDTPLMLTQRTVGLEFFEGVGALPTMKLHLGLEAAWPHDGSGAVVYEDRNEPNRLGWREIAIRPSTDVRVSGETASFTDRTRELAQYPADPNAAFPQETSARFGVAGMLANGALPAAEAGAAAAPPRPLAAGPSVPADQFAGLISQERLTPAVVILSLLIAFSLGGFHALSPGHGKTIVAAYLIGSRGTAKHALLLGAIVTAAHTIGVFLLGLVTLALSTAIVPEQLYPPVQLLSGAAIVLIGATMFVRRLRPAPVHSHGRFGAHTHGAMGHDHHHHEPGDHHHRDHDHDHDHHHGHTHEIPEDGPSARNLVALGVSGGILPCPSALVVLLGAIALHRIGFGLVLIVAFSMGLAAVLCGIGMLVVRAGSLLSRFESTSSLVRRAPAFSALLVTVLGVLLVVRSLTDFGPRPVDVIRQSPSGPRQAAGAAP